MENGKWKMENDVFSKKSCTFQKFVVPLRKISIERQNE